MRYSLLAAVFPVLLAAQDAREIMRRAVEVDQRNSEIALNYTFLQREETKMLDGDGKVKSAKIRTFDITLLEGSAYRRLVARDDKPLAPAEEKKEEENLRRSIEERQKESPEQREKRIAEWRRKQRENREPMLEVPDAFDFTMAGEEKLDGFDVWVIDAQPRPGYKARSKMGRDIFPKVKCRFWIVKKDFYWAKIEVETLDTISRGMVVLRLGKGSRIVLEQTRVNDEVWLPRVAVVTASGRILLVKSVRVAMRYDYSGYKKFQAESRIVDTAEPEP